MGRLTRTLDDERGVTAIVVAICLIALFGAAVLSVDAGALWSTRRHVVSATDAAAEAAARYFKNGGNPCNSTDVTTAETVAKNIFLANTPGGLHSTTDTPNGFQVVVNPATPCSSSAFHTGHVRFDGRLNSQAIFSGALGIGKSQAFSSSTAQWGFVTTNPGALRPWIICDQTKASPALSPPPSPSPTTAPFPHYQLWNWLVNNQITQTYYNTFFDPSHSAQHPASDYPTVDPNGVNYLSPAQGGSVVHTIGSTADGCSGQTAFRGWVTFDGSHGVPSLRDWIANGYTGTVSVGPTPARTCTPSYAGGDCEGDTGNKNGATKELDQIVCSTANTNFSYSTMPTDAQCIADGLAFPIPVADTVTGTDIHQVSFMYIILRGYTLLHGNDGAYFDVSFVKLVPHGSISATLSGGQSDLADLSTSICNVDHYTGSPCAA